MKTNSKTRRAPQSDSMGWMFGVFLLLGMSLALTARADGEPESVLTINQAVQEGMENSPLIQKAQAKVEQSSGKKAEVLGAGFLPKVSANANHYFNTKYEYLNVPFNGSNVLFPSIYPSTTLGVNAMV